MASLAQVASPKKSLSKDCFDTRTVMPKRSSLDSSNALSSKRMKLDAPSIASLNTSQEAESGSDDDLDQPGRSLTTAIDQRLSTLQLLLPQGSKMDDDEVLRVLIEYVKQLETEIKMYNSSDVDGCAEFDNGADEMPLQRRGLCIVPLSTLARAL